MNNFVKTLDALPEAYQEFFDRLVEECGFQDVSDQELIHFSVEVESMFVSALIEAASKVLDEEDLDFIDSYTLVHPEASELDIYFGVAAEKPEIDKLLKETLDEIFHEIVTLRKLASDARK